MECYYTAWGVSEWDGLLVYGIGYSFTGCIVSIEDSVEKQDGVLIYRMSSLYT